MNKQIISLFAVALAGVTSASTTPDALSVSPGASLRDALNAPYAVDVYFEYRWVKPFPTGPSFVDDLEAGMWGAKITLRERTRVNELKSLLDHAPIVGQVGSGKERDEFSRGASVIIEMGPKRSDRYYVSACSFIREGDLNVHGVGVELQRYFFLSDGSSKCQ